MAQTYEEFIQQNPGANINRGDYDQMLTNIQGISSGAPINAGGFPFPSVGTPAQYPADPLYDPYQIDIPLIPGGSLNEVIGLNNTTPFNPDTGDYTPITGGGNWDGGSSLSTPTFSGMDDAGIWGMNKAVGLVNEGSSPFNYGADSIASQNMIRDLAGSNQYPADALSSVGQQMGGVNPFIQGFGGMDTQSPVNFNSFTNQANPYGDQIGSGFQPNQYTQNLNQADINPFQSQVQGLSQNTVNPFLQGFQDFGGQQDDAFGATVDTALDRVQDTVNSQFGLSGRTGSGAHQGVMTRELGDIANQMYSDNFAQNANRNLQAMQSGSGIFGDDQLRALSAMQTGGDIYGDTQGRNLQATGMGIDAFNVDQNRNLDYLTQAGQFANTDIANQMAATGLNADLWQQGFGNQMSTMGQGADLWGQDQSRSLQAAGMVPSLSQAQYTDALMLNQLGADADLNRYNNANMGWDDLQKYGSVMASLQGSQQVIPNDPSTGGFDQALGLAMAAGGLGWSPFG